MKIRLCTIGVPRFLHDGLEAVDSWREFDVAKAAEPARKAFIEHTGRYVQVHPDDEVELSKYLEKNGGLEFFTDGNGRRRIRSIAVRVAAKSAART